jgi:FkbM family methyltransferase
LTKFSKLFAKSLIDILSSFNYGRAFVDILIKNVYLKTKTIKHGDIKLNFYIPNRLTYWRIKTFSSKEPHTLSWIENFEKDSVFYDIGSNIGLYSIYASKKVGCDTYAFEPSCFNLELLAKNIYLNKLSKDIKIIPIPLSSKKKISTFNMSNTDAGGALSTFDEKFTYDGSTLNNLFKYSTISFTLDECVDILNLPPPDYIKIDVDGIEHLILSGGLKVLKKSKSILIELNENFKDQHDQSINFLKDCGFKFLKKSSLDIDKQDNYKGMFNQIWIKK